MTPRAPGILTAIAVLALWAPLAFAENTSTTIASGDPPPSEFERVTRDEIERSGADRLDEALEDIPGVIITRQSGLAASATVDGLPAAQVVILVDGAPVGRALNSRAGPATDLASVPVDPERIRRIDVQRGTGPAGSGDAGGVVINIVTDRTTDEVRASISGRTGIAETHGSVEHGIRGTVAVPFGDGFSVEVGGDYSTELEADVDDDGTPDRPDQSLAGGQLALGWSRSRNESLTLSSRYTVTDTQRGALTGEELRRREADSPVLLNGLFDDQTQMQVLDLRLVGDWRPSRDAQVQHTTSIVRQAHRFDKTRVRDGELEPNNETVDLGVRQSVVATLFRGDHTIEPELVIRGGNAQRENFATDDPGFSRSFASVGAGATESWDVGEIYNLQARGYLEYHSQYDVGGVASLGFAVQPWDEFGVFVRGAATRRTPTPEELYFRFDHADVGYIIEGNPDVQPERLLAARAGFDGIVDRWTYSLEGYYQHLDNAISAAPLSVDGGGTATFQYVNLDRVRSAGLNVSSKLGDLPGGLSLRVSYAWLAFSEVDETQQRLAFTAEHDGSATLLGEWSRDRLSAWTRLRARTALTVPQGSPPADALATLDVGMAWAFDFGLRAQVDVENVTGVQDPTWGPFTGQTVFFTLAYTYQPPDSAP